MKKYFIIIAMFMLVFNMAFADTTRTAVVIEVNEQENLLVLFDGAGLFWEWEGIEDLDVFDVVSFKLIDTQNTESILDDLISQPIYSGIKVDKTWLIEKVAEKDLQLAMELLGE